MICETLSVCTLKDFPFSYRYPYTGTVRLRNQGFRKFTDTIFATIGRTDKKGKLILIYFNIFNNVRVKKSTNNLAKHKSILALWWVT
jgi:hypothetical protein